MRVKSPLDPYLDIDPGPEDLASVPSDELRTIIREASGIEALTPYGVRETKKWARNIRTIAESLLANRHGE